VSSKKRVQAKKNGGPRIKDLLIEKWNVSRPSDCPVGPIPVIAARAQPPQSN
jgi:hypothetical protein